MNGWSVCFSGHTPPPIGSCASMLNTFTAPAGQSIRVVQINDKPWFVAVDVCRALGLAPHPAGGFGHHLGALGADEVTPTSDLGVTLPGKGMRSSRAVAESGLYKLILRSDKPEARAFQDWVTREVLPAIRKDGAYVMGEEKVRTGELTTGGRLPRQPRGDSQEAPGACRRSARYCPTGGGAGESVGALGESSRGGSFTASTQAVRAAAVSPAK